MNIHLKTNLESRASINPSIVHQRLGPDTLKKLETLLFQ